MPADVLPASFLTSLSAYFSNSSNFNVSKSPPKSIMILPGLACPANTGGSIVVYETTFLSPQCFCKFSKNPLHTTISL